MKCVRQCRSPNAWSTPLPLRKPGAPRAPAGTAGGDTPANSPTSGAPRFGAHPSPMRLVPYHASLRAEWDAFAATATAGTFLFQRRYLEYHADRFTDASLLVYDAKNRLVALLPANRVGDELHSHQGLTYGGFVTRGPYAFQLAACFNSLVAWCAAQGIQRVLYKPVPFIYATYPEQTDLYCLFRLGATLAARHLATTIEQDHARGFAELRRRGAKKALRHGLRVDETTDFAEFWHVLEVNLREKYAATVVHSLAEITALRAQFPAGIRLHVASDAAGAVVAGVVVYVTTQVAHVQYISATTAGRAVGALDLLFTHLVQEVYAGVRYFDFGTSNERQGQYLNHNLLFQKEGFGGRGVCYDTYAFDVGSRIE